MTRLALPTPPPVQGSLALEFVLPDGIPSIPAQPRHLALVPPTTPGDDFGPVLTPAAALPPVAAWSARLALALSQVLDGHRPPGQLARWVTSDVDAGLRRWARARALHPGRASASPLNRRAPRAVRSLRWTQPVDYVAEVAAIVAGGSRPIVLTLRVEGRDGRWVCVHAGTPDGWSIGGTQE